MVMYNYIHIDDDDRFYLALFSVLEQTQCALVACDSKHGPIYIYNEPKKVM